jgi:Xaa-Pro dipeptidase
VTAPGTNTQSASPGSDDAALRSERRTRVFEAMDRAMLDVLVLGRRDAVAYATGARSLWTAGTRPPGPACVLVGDRRASHVLSTWDAGVPPEIPFEHLYGVTWNPAILAASLQAIPGFVDAGRIGVDALSPGVERLLARLCPSATIVPADDLLVGIRARKLPAEIERVRTATAVAAAAVDAATAALNAHAGHATAQAAAIRTAAARSVTVPSSGVTVRRGGAWGTFGVDVGLLVDGYEGGLGRTVGTTPGGEADESVATQRRLVEACRPGATAADLRADASGTARWMVRGSGMGFEPPVITTVLGDGVRLAEDMVLSVEVDVAGFMRRDLVAVTAGAPEIMTP